MDQFRSVARPSAPIRRSLAAIARRAVPAQADFCLIYLTHGDSLVCAAAVHASPAGERLVRALARTYRVRRDDRLSTVASVVRTGRAAIRNAIRPDSAPKPANTVAALHEQLAPRSAAVVPVVLGANRVGAVSLSYAESGRTYTIRDLDEARHLASCVAQVLRFAGSIHARLRPAARGPRQGPTLRRRVAPRN